MKKFIQKYTVSNMAKTNKHIVLQLRRKVSLMAQEIEGLRIELSKKEERVFELETRLGGGKRE